MKLSPFRLVHNFTIFEPRYRTTVIFFKNDNITQSRTLSVSVTREHVKADPQYRKVNIFDRKTKAIQLQRAAVSEDAEFHSYLKNEIGYRLADRIYDIKRKFPRVLDLGCGRGHVSRHVDSGSVDELVMCDKSEMLMSSAACDDEAVKVSKVVCDEEDLLNVFEPDSFNMVISNLTLHWVNDLTKCFSQVMTILKSDGVFLGSLFGSDTLYELRSALQLAESERRGGISPHISPFARPNDIGNLLHQSGFVMQTIDTDEEVYKYPSMFELLEELKGMGENNASWNRSLHLPRDTLLAASAIYYELYGPSANNKTDKSQPNDGEKTEADNFDGINASFQIIYFIGWKPDPSQPQPAPRGSANVSLKELCKMNDIVVKEERNLKLDEEK